MQNIPIKCHGLSRYLRQVLGLIVSFTLHTQRISVELMRAEFKSP